MRDKEIKCLNCGNYFVWSKDEQVVYESRDLLPPEYCPICRGMIEARKKDNARTKYER